LLSRAVVYVLQPLAEADLRQMLIGKRTVPIGAVPAVAKDAAADRLLAYADGDARRLLNTLETLGGGGGQRKTDGEVTDDVAAARAG
jgi:putative ATPase